MAYRYTNTEKWSDPWFLELDWRQKVVFLYLCDQCDMAGFYEINLRKMAWDIAIDCADVEGALKGLKSKLLYSSNGKYLFLRNFLKHQKNLPLNEKNNAHTGIIKRLNENLNLFNFQSINDYFLSPIQGANKGLISPYGNGNGNGNGKLEGGMGETKKNTRETKKNQFAEFVSMTNAEYQALVTEYGETDTKEFIKILDNYKGSNGKKYKSDYRAILNWVIESFREKNAKKSKNESHSRIFIPEGIIYEGDTI